MSQEKNDKIKNSNEEKEDEENRFSWDEEEYETTINYEKNEYDKTKLLINQTNSVSKILCQWPSISLSIDEMIKLFEWKSV